MANDIDCSLGADDSLDDNPLAKLLDDFDAHPMDLDWIQGYDFETIDCFDRVSEIVDTLTYRQS